MLYDFHYIVSERITDPPFTLKLVRLFLLKEEWVQNAAVAVAVARALFAHYEKILTDKELWEIVQSSGKNSSWKSVGNRRSNHKW